MVRVKSLDQIKENYKNATSEAERRYRQGVSSASGVIAASIEGQKNYEEQMTKSDVLKRRENALRKVSDEDWKREALNVGSRRIGEGMRNAIDSQAQGYAPYKAALEAKTLTPRSTDPIANLQRVREVVEAQVAKKKEILG